MTYQLWLLLALFCALVLIAYWASGEDEDGKP